MERARERGALQGARRFSPMAGGPAVTQQVSAEGRKGGKNGNHTRQTAEVGEMMEIVRSRGRKGGIPSSVE